MTRDKLSSAGALLGRKGGKAKAKKYTREELAEMARGKNPRALSAEQLALLYKLRSDGVSVKEIAERLGLAEITVWKRLQKRRQESSAAKEDR